MWPHLRLFHPPLGSVCVLWTCLYSCVFRVVPLAGGPCSLCRWAEERSSGGRQNRRGCRSSASPPLRYPWSGEIHCPTTGSPGTHTHTRTRTHTTGTHTYTDKYAGDAGGRQTRMHAGANMCTCGHARTKKHAGKCIHHRKGYKSAHVHTLVCFCSFLILCAHTQTHTHVTHVHIHPHDSTFHTPYAFLSDIPELK